MWYNAIDAEPHTLGWRFEQAELDLAKRNKCVALKSKCSFQMKAIFLHLIILLLMLQAIKIIKKRNINVAFMRSENPPDISHWK